MMKDSILQRFHWIKNCVKQYRYPLLVLLLGACLMLLPTEKKQHKVQESVSLEQDVELSAQMEELLGLIEGAGKVRVLLTLESGACNQYQEDVKTSSDPDTVHRQTETVLVSAGGEETPLTVKTTYPIYKGAVIVCQGADRASVKLNLIQAVSSLTGLSSDHITVVKMQGD